LGKDIGQSSALKTFVLDVGYIAALRNDGDTKVTLVKHRLTILTFFDLILCILSNFRGQIGQTSE